MSGWRAPQNSGDGFFMMVFIFTGILFFILSGLSFTLEDLLDMNFGPIISGIYLMFLLVVSFFISTIGLSYIWYRK